MIINKNDELVNLLKTFTKDNKTPDCSTVVSKVCFKKEQGIKFTFSENINYLIYKNSEVDFNAKIDGSLFVLLIHYNSSLPILQVFFMFKKHCLLDASLQAGL